jgi:hypothetical protein
LRAEKATISAPPVSKPPTPDPDANAQLIWRALNAIIDDGGAGDLDQKTRMIMVQDLERGLQSHVERLTLERLDDQGVEALERLADSGASQERIRAFLTSKGINHQAVLADALKQLRSRYVKDR